MAEDIIFEDAAIDVILDEAAEELEDAEADLCDLGTDDILDFMVPEQENQC